MYKDQWFDDLSVRAKRALERAGLPTKLGHLRRMDRRGELLRRLLYTQNCGRKTILNIYESVNPGAVVVIPQRENHPCEFGHFHFTKENADNCRAIQENRRRLDAKTQENRMVLRAFFCDVAKGTPLRLAARNHGLSVSTADIKFKRISSELLRLWNPTDGLHKNSYLRHIRFYSHEYIKMMEKNPGVPVRVHWNSIPDRDCTPVQ